MARSTRSPSLALERLAEFLGADLSVSGRGRRRIVIPLADWGYDVEIEGRINRVLYATIHLATTPQELGGREIPPEDVATTMNLRRAPTKGPAHETNLIRAMVGLANPEG